MKSIYYQSILAVTAIGVFYTNLPQYLYEAQGMQSFEAPKHWVMAYCLLSLPVLIKRVTASNVLKSPAVIWCFGYALLTVIWFLWSSQSDLMWQEVRWRFLAIVVVLTGLMVFWQAGATELARKTLVAAVLLGVALNVYEVFVPMSFSQTLGRSAGFYQNPNISGEALVLGMVLSVTVVAPRYRGPFVLLTGIGILATLSRASILAWVIAAAGFIFVNRVSLKSLFLSGAIGLVLAILIILPRWDLVLTMWDRTGVMNTDVLERLAWFTDPSGISDKSSWERKYVAKLAWEKIADHPFLGSGTGSFNESYVLPHNHYLALMLDHGIIGAMIVPSLILAVTWGARAESRCVAVIYGCSLMVLSFFTHAILTYEYSLMLLALMAAIAGTSQRDARTVTVKDQQPPLWPSDFGHGFPREKLSG